MFKLKDIIFFRSINHEEIIEKIKNGYFSSKDVEPLIDRLVNSFKVAEMKVDHKEIDFKKDLINYDRSKEKYSMKVNGNLYNIYVTNVGVYVEDTDVILRNKKCDWCKSTMKDFYIGIPISMVLKKDIYVVEVVGCFDSFECCYSSLLRESNYTFQFRDSVYINSEIILKFIYRKVTGLTDLKQKIDYKLEENSQVPSELKCVKIPGFDLVPLRETFQEIT